MYLSKHVSRTGKVLPSRTPQPRRLPRISRSSFNEPSRPPVNKPKRSLSHGVYLTDGAISLIKSSALSPMHDCRVFGFVISQHSARMPSSCLHIAPPRFTLIGHPLGGYLAFELFRRHRSASNVSPPRYTGGSGHGGLAPRPASRHPQGAGRWEIDCAGSRLPTRWMHPANRPRPDGSDGEHGSQHRRPRQLISSR